MTSTEPPITPELIAAARPQARRVRAHPRADRPRADASPSSASSRRCGTSTARTNPRKSICARCRPVRRWVIQGPGENAGVVDIGDGLAVVFKMESHNHPSYIEPYQGAATGVGGILRDVFTMGARPIACAERAVASASPSHPKTRHLVSGVVAGDRRLRQFLRRADGRRRSAISTAATTATSWSTPWRSASPRPTRSSTPRPPASACRSSISARRPAATASTAPPWRRPSSTTDAEEKRPTVQVGDPFAEKLLLEACLELMAERLRHRHPGHGRGGPDLLGGRDGRQGRSRRRARPRQGALPRDRHDAPTR